jgi:hypothetical protein
MWTKEVMHKKKIGLIMFDIVSEICKKKNTNYLGTYMAGHPLVQITVVLSPLAYPIRVLQLRDHSPRRRFGPY